MLTASQSTSRRKAPNFFATWTNAHRRYAEFRSTTRSRGSRASGSSGFRISITRCGSIDAGASTTIRYGSVCTPTLCPNRAEIRDEINWPKVSFTRLPKHALITTRSRATSTVTRRSVGTGLFSRPPMYSVNCRVPSAPAGYPPKSSVPRRRPTSWATGNETGMSSPIQLGTSPISRTASTMIRSSLNSTNRHVVPRITNVAPSFAFSATNHSSRVPITLRAPMSTTRYVCTSGIIEMFSRKYRRDPGERPNRSSLYQILRRDASCSTTSTKSTRFRVRNGYDRFATSYPSSMVS